MSRILQRGFAVLPALVLVAILGVAAIGIENLTPQSDSRSQTAALTPATDPLPEQKTSNNFKSTAPKSCEEAKKKAFASKGPNDGLSINTNKGQPGTQDACFGAIFSENGKTGVTLEDYKCVGRGGKATIAGGQAITETEALPGSTPGQCVVNICQQDEQGKMKCGPALLFKGGIDANSAGAVSSEGVPTLVSGDGGVKAELVPSEQAQGIADAFSEQVAQKEAELEAEQKDLRLCKPGSPCIDPVERARLAAITETRNELNALQAQQTKFLADNKVSLMPGAGAGGGSPVGGKGGGSPATSGGASGDGTGAGGGPAGSTGGGPTGQNGAPCPPGQPCNSSNQGKTGLGPDGQQGNQTFPPSRPPSSGGGGISPFLKGAIVGALGGGLLGWFLNDELGAEKCKNEPPKPNPASCNGEWDAVKEKKCTKSWKCKPKTAIKAELSCEPKLADVGTQLTISYSCSSGTATSTAFTATTQPSGVVSLKVAAPPSNFTTATYPLFCLKKDKPEGQAECTVQINKPFIILVANPKTVEQNGTSVLGWLTGGMKTCVISSPDQPDFTAENLLNTSTSGVASSSPISTDSTFLLHCETLGGGVKDATTTVRIQ